MVGVGLLDRPLRPARRLVTDSQMDEFGQRRHQPKRGVHVPAGDGVLERDPQVVVFGQHPLHPRRLVGAMHTDRGALGQLGVVLGVSGSAYIRNAVLPQPITTVRA